MSAFSCVKRLELITCDIVIELLKRHKAPETSSTESPTPVVAVPVAPPPPPPAVSQPTASTASSTSTLETGVCHPSHHVLRSNLISRAADPFPLDPSFNLQFDSNFSFGSEAANLEYSILSAILGNPSPRDTPSPAQQYSWPSNDSLTFGQSPQMGSYSELLQTSDGPSAASTGYLTYPYQDPPRPTELSELNYPAEYRQQAQQAEKPSQNEEIHPLAPRYPLDSRPRSPAYSSFLEPSSTSSEKESSSTPVGVSKLQSINDRIQKPYDYTEGYHFLMKHLPSRYVTTSN